MCGFLGGLDLTGNLDEEQYAKHLKQIKHRGPDSDGYFFTNKIFLGHTRLSIIDLSSEADQPFRSADGRFHLVYNGEIYNYKALKSGLNCNFKTTSDTEVIIKGYEEHGVNFFKNFRGIYAFCLFDSHEEKLLLVRDPAGIKPLYLSKDANKYFFSSEIKGILPFLTSKSINEKVIKSYLNIGYCPEPYTAYKNIEAVQPGYVYEINRSGSLYKYPFFKYDYKGNNSLTFGENREQVGQLVQNAVKKNLVADVPVTVALSGGIDSSLLYAYGVQADAGLKGLTVGFNDDSYDESQVAKLYSSTVNGSLEVIRLENDFTLEVLDKIFLHFDQPYSDSSAIPVYYLTKAASQISKVLIGGDGGDELFNGYPSQTWLYYLYYLKKRGLTRKAGDFLFYLANNFYSGNKKRVIDRLHNIWTREPSRMLYEWHSWFPSNTMYNGKKAFKFSEEEGFSIYEQIFIDEQPEQYDQHIIFDYFRKRMLSDYLRKTDMMSMLNGVEYRVPLLDEDLASFAFTIPFNQKSDLKNTKAFLRSIHSDIYPKEASKLAKTGFSVPLDKSLSINEFDVMKHRMLNDKDNILAEYVSADYINYLFAALRAYKKKAKNISRAGIYQRILMLYSLQLWYKNIISQ
jgi:asparagine synthase (glutamine-hydrolysing)